MGGGVGQRRYRGGRREGRGVGQGAGGGGGLQRINMTMARAMVVI